MISNSQLIQRLFGKVGTDNLRSRLARGAVGTFGLKIGFTGLSFVVSVLLARVLGVAGYGVYSYVIAWVQLLGVPAILGLDKLLVRNIATYQARSAWGLMSGLLRWANRTVLVVSLGLALLAAGVAGVLADGFDFHMLLTFWLALFILPLTALTALRSAAMRGLHHVVTGQLPETIIRPLLLIALVGCAYLFLGGDLNASWAIGMNVVASGVAFLFGALLLLKTLPQVAKEATPAYQTRAWVSSIMPMVFIGGVQMISARTDILMLGAITGVEAVGVYHVVNGGVQFIAFALTAVNAALGPTIASLYAKGDMKRLQGVVTKSARAMLFVSLPIAVGLIIFGHGFLLIFFGPEFTRGQVALAILSVGQLVNVAAGSVGLLLVMTGYERDVALSVGISAVLNVILNAVLIPQWGLEGAATATATSRIITNLLVVVWMYKRLGIHPTALGNISLWRGK